jgi:hypothetical protein
MRLAKPIVKLASVFGDALAGDAPMHTAEPY